MSHNICTVLWIASCKTERHAKRPAKCSFGGLHVSILRRVRVHDAYRKTLVVLIQSFYKYTFSNMGLTQLAHRIVFGPFNLGFGAGRDIVQTFK